MKWSPIVGVGFGVTAVGLFVLALGFLLGPVEWGLALTAVGLSIVAIGGAARYLNN